MTPRLLLVDALGLVYRAYHAIAGLATSAGQPTNATFGFIKMLQQFERVIRPSHVAVVFDGGLPASRLELLPDYKAQRPPMPEPLRGQLPLIEEYLDAAQIARIRIEGQEADDVLASIACRAAADRPVTIATSDKDFMQLVSDSIVLAAPGRIESPLGPAEVLAKTGVTPAQIVEWLALTGDASDNIPGVPGVGPKTAAALLRQWGSLDAAFEHSGEVRPEPLRHALIEHRDRIARNRALLTLRTDLEFGMGLEAMRAQPPEPARLLALYERLEFHSLARAAREPTLF